VIYRYVREFRDITSDSRARVLNVLGMLFETAEDLLQ